MKVCSPSYTNVWTISYVPTPLTSMILSFFFCSVFLLGCCCFFGGISSLFLARYLCGCTIYLRINKIEIILKKGAWPNAKPYSVYLCMCRTCIVCRWRVSLVPSPPPQLSSLAAAYLHATIAVSSLHVILDHLTRDIV